MIISRDVAAREGLVRHDGNVDEMRLRPEPQFVAVGVAMQQIDHRVAAVSLGGVARRQIDGHVSIGRIAFEISFQRLAVNFDPLHLTVRRMVGALCCQNARASQGGHEQ